MSVDSGMGNKAADDDLTAIEEGNLPGVNNIETTIASLRKRLAQDNPTNSDEGLQPEMQNVERVDVAEPPRAQTPLEQQGLNEGFNDPVEQKVPTSLKTVGGGRIFRADALPTPDGGNPEDMPPKAPKVDGGNPDDAMAPAMASFNKSAWVMEHGEIKCAGSCESYFVPNSWDQVKNAHCGFPGCADAEGVVDYTRTSHDGVEQFVRNNHADDHFTLVANKLPHDVEEGDVVDGNVIKTTVEANTRLANTEDYISAFYKTATDSDLYKRGYMDAMQGKELDEDLAELSDDYFHGYDQYKYYHLDNQASAPQTLYDIKPNSNLNPRMTQGEVDFGPNQLTDGHSFATHASKTASIHHYCDAMKDGEACTESYQPGFSRGHEFGVPDNWASCWDPEDDEGELHFCPKHADVLEQMGHELTTEPVLGWKRSRRGSYHHSQDRATHASRGSDNLKLEGL